MPDVRQGGLRPVRLLPPAAAVPQGPGLRGQPAPAARPVPVLGAQQLHGHGERILSAADQLEGQSGGGGDARLALADQWHVKMETVITC